MTKKVSVSQPVEYIQASMRVPAKLPPMIYHRAIALLGVVWLATQAVAQPVERSFLVVLGVAQDGGFPQAGCGKACCVAAWKKPLLRRYVSCLGLVEVASGRRWLFDATPDFKEQLRWLQQVKPASFTKPLDGIFITHGHIGHYSGLMNLGREVMGTQHVRVYAMPQMQGFVRQFGPWNQLLKLSNIDLQPLAADSTIELSPALRVTPLLVPHRAEYTETVGFRIEGPRRKAVFIPDIDKWALWNRSIESVIQSVDYVLIDATFYADGEIPGRSMKDIPHPFIEETMQRLSVLPLSERNKVYFIHLNHTNPALQKGSAAQQKIKKGGFHLAEQGQRFEL